MEDTQLTLLDSPALPATRQPASPALPAAPTIEQTLYLAVERGADADTLERLVALAERVNAQRAEQAMNEAMANFRREVGPIIKNRDAVNPKNENRVMYRFADLSEITKVVDPPLFLNGLSYSWDTDVQSDQTIITCIVRHVQGASRSAKFTCKGSGTPIMNAAQVAASAVTFGRRYSLLLALGLTIDDDDDGRRAAPSPKPDADPAAPIVPTRAERATQPPAAPADPNRVTPAELGDLFRRYKATEPYDPSMNGFVAWARKSITGFAAEADLTKTSSWTRAQVEACREVLQ